MGTSLLSMPWALEQAGLVMGLLMMVSINDDDDDDDDDHHHHSYDVYGDHYHDEQGGLLMGLLMMVLIPIKSIKYNYLSFSHKNLLA